MTTNLHASIASLDLASLNFNVVDLVEADLEATRDQETAETISREDLMSSFSKFDSLVSLDNVSRDEEDDDGSENTVEKFLHHYEASQQDITADLRAFQSSIGLLLQGKENEKRKRKKGLGKKKKSRRKSTERKHSVERKVVEMNASPAVPKVTPQANMSTAAVQDLRNEPCALPVGGNDDLTGMTITVDPPASPQSAARLRTDAGGLPDPSTMSAKEILAELKGHNLKNMLFIEKSEMIGALNKVRGNTNKATKVPSKASQKESINKAPSTPRASRSRSRSAEPSPRSRTFSPVRQHLNTLKDLMDLDIQDKLDNLDQIQTPGRLRRRMMGLKKVRSKSIGTFDADSPVIRDSAWWNLTVTTDESSKSSKESKNSRRKKGLHKALSSNDIGDIEEVDVDDPKSNANASWDQIQTPGRRMRKKDLKKSSSKSKLDIDIGAPPLGEFAATPKTRNKRIKKGRSKSINMIDMDDDKPEKKNSWWNLGFSTDESSKRSKESKNSQRKKGMRKALSSNAVVDIDDGKPKSNANASWDQIQTPGRRRKKGLRSRSRSYSKLNIDEPPIAFVNVGVEPKTKRNTSLKRSNSNPTLGNDLTDDDGSSKRSKDSGRKRGLRRSNSGSKLQIDEVVIGKSKKKNMGLQRASSQPALGINLDYDDSGSSKRSKDSGGRKKGLRKSSSGGKLDIDGFVTQPKTNRRSTLRKSRSNPTIDMDIPREVSVNRSMANSNWDDDDVIAVGGKPYKEKQTVLYTSSNGEKEEAVILKIYLDDKLLPFYDIKLSISGKEKQTDDGRLSPLKASRPLRSKSVDVASKSPPARSMSVDVPRGLRGSADLSPVSLRRRLKKTPPPAADNSRPARSRSVGASQGLRGPEDSSLASVRRRLKKPPGRDSNAAATARQSPVGVRKKLSEAQSPGTLRKAYRVL